MPRPQIVWLLYEISVDHMAPLLLEFKRTWADTLFLSSRWDSVHWNPRLPAVTGGAVYPEALGVRWVGRTRRIRLGSGPGQYDRGITLLSPAMLFELLRLRPRFIFCTAFSVWTMMAASLKWLGGWKLIVLWEGSSPSVDMLDAPARLRLRRWIARRVDAFVSQTRSGVDYLVEHVGLPEERASRIPYLTIDPQDPPRHAAPAPISTGAAPRFLCVGQLIPRKGVHHLLKAWGLLRRVRPQGASLWIVGEGAQQADLERQASEQGLTDVHFVGWIGPTELHSWYEACDVVVFPTLEDTWGMIVLEAMAHARTVLCSKHAGSAEMVDEGETGFVFDPMDEAGLADLIQRFVDAPEMAARLGCRAVEVVRRHTPSTAVAGFGALMRRLEAGERAEVKNNS